jgi:hypothetical protein
MRRRGSETRPRIGGPAARDSGGASGQVDEIKLRDGADGMQESDRADKPIILDKAPMTQFSPQRDQQDGGTVQRSDATMPQIEASTTIQNQVSGTTDLASVEWSYLDTQGVVQGEWLRSLGGPDF